MQNNTDIQNQLQWSLLSLRVTIFIVMFVWTLDKFVNPAHGMAIFEKFYGIGGVPEMAVYVMGALQLALVLAFLAGLAKKYTYGLIFILHGGSTLSSFPQYLDAFNHLLFFAAWPMWGACFALFLLRDADTKFAIGK
ncbi:MAG TPA: hypothetical protein DEB45_05410 [Alteromonas australica]|uniref:DoxX family protein n=2 Tax=root TaxID=1 RepID=A0A358DWM0_9ALTE|nr:hypothetical protein [Alteromonas macleodii]HBU50681.1 hypothetical protein [Alteromonas australica]|tara:strand:+ start:2669 stop:3079 length:411 start_codon:yes stop_codon:yes gene_type:complete